MDLVTDGPRALPPLAKMQLDGLRRAENRRFRRRLSESLRVLSYYLLREEGHYTLHPLLPQQHQSSVGVGCVCTASYKHDVRNVVTMCSYFNS